MVSKRTLSEDGVFAPYTGPKVELDKDYIPGSQLPDKETIATVAAAAKALVDANSSKGDEAPTKDKVYTVAELEEMSIPELRAIHKELNLEKPENQKRDTFLKMIIPFYVETVEDSGL